MLDNLIQQYLQDNNLTGENGCNYDFRYNDIDGYYIDMWNYEIDKPVFTQEEIEAEIIRQKNIPIKKTEIEIKIDELENRLKILEAQ